MYHRENDLSQDAFNEETFEEKNLSAKSSCISSHIVIFAILRTPCAHCERIVALQEDFMYIDCPKRAGGCHSKHHRQTVQSSTMLARDAALELNLRRLACLLSGWHVKKYYIATSETHCLLLIMPTVFQSMSENKTISVFFVSTSQRFFDAEGHTEPVHVLSFCSAFGLVCTRPGPTPNPARGKHC